MYKLTIQQWPQSNVLSSRVGSAPLFCQDVGIRQVNLVGVGGRAAWVMAPRVQKKETMQRNMEPTRTNNLTLTLFNFTERIIRCQVPM